MDEKIIYTVSAFTKDNKSRSRLWGWLPTFEEAHKSLYANDDFILESGTYQYILIESVKSGIFNTDNKTWWFKAIFDFVTNEYDIFMIDTPPWAEGIFNFSMG